MTDLSYLFYNTDNKKLKEMNISNKSSLYETQNLEKKRSLRFIALCSVAFSTVSVLACIITLPIVCYHAQNIHSFMQNEIDFCKVIIYFLLIFFLIKIYYIKFINL